MSRNVGDYLGPTMRRRNSLFQHHPLQIFQIIVHVLKNDCSFVLVTQKWTEYVLSMRLQNKVKRLLSFTICASVITWPISFHNHVKKINAIATICLDYLFKDTFWCASYIRRRHKSPVRCVERWDIPWVWMYFGTLRCCVHCKLFLYWHIYWSDPIQQHQQP